MKIKKLFLTVTIQSILFAATPVFAGDVEIHLPAASDAMTIDQPAGTELMRVNGDGSVGVGTSTPSDGSANGGQALKLDVEGAVGATHFCDEKGENCQTAANMGAANAGMAMAFKIISTDTTTTQTRSQWYTMDTEWEATPEINTFNTATFANGVFTVGVGESGLYELFAKTNIASDQGRDYAGIFVNGVAVGRTSSIKATSVVPSPGHALVNLAEGDQVEIRGYYDHDSTNRTSSCSAITCYFTAHKLGAAATGGGADNLGSHTATKDIDLAANKLVGNGGTEGVAIDAGGNVGIGTTAPVGKVHINNGRVQVGTEGDQTYSEFVVRRQSPASSNENHASLFVPNSNIWAGGIGSNGALGIFTNGEFRMTVQDDGNVGIGANVTSDGTASGGQALKLDVEGAIGATHLCDANGENCMAVADLGTGGGGTQKEYLDTHILINYINNTGAITVTEPNFDLSTLTTVPAWATHAIVMGRTLVAQSGGFTGGSNSSSIKLSHNGVNFNNLAVAAAYGGSGQADRSDDSNTQEVRIRNGKFIGFISATTDGGKSGQSIQAILHLIGFAGYQ